MQLEKSVPARPGKFKVLSVILIAVFSLAVGVAGGYWVGSRQQQSLPTALQASPQLSGLPSAPPVRRLSLTPTISTSQTDPTSNWRTYRNEEYGIEVRYPSVWSIYYEAEQKDILGQLDSNRKYHLDRPIKLVSWKDGDAPYPDTGYISFFLYTAPPTEHFIATRTASYRNVKVNKRMINGRTFTEVYLSYLGEEQYRPPAFSKVFYTKLPHVTFQTLSLDGNGYEKTRKQLEETLEVIVNSLKITH